MSVSERGPCAPVRKGERSGGRREKKSLLLLVGEKLGEVREVADQAESQVSDVALLGKFPHMDS